MRLPLQELELMPSSEAEQLILQMVEAVPGLRPLYEAHISINDELLAHVFMGDVSRFVISGFQDTWESEPYDPPLGEVGEVFGILEIAFAKGHPYVTELISVSFLENIYFDSLDWKKESRERIRSSLGPSLLEEFEKIEEFFESCI
ncbi:MAG: hypothetical protein DWQ01_17585 [Planctomycetota bacterium]|nr:MAG: hypothetical protein DWQ01_17585 [Planctomycetota bacterium]